MIQFASNLNAQRDRLGLSIDDILREMNRKGFDVGYSTVASWFNGQRGKRWKVDELRALLDILQTDLQSMAGEGAELVEDKVPAAVAREMSGLTEAQQQVILATVRAMKIGR